ncbi:uncharacterized protein LOC119735151 [Patiria miniata]|uniref:F-box domain-containing protein n=1 Tax=Patiria miniata TaxID=46514 RepID=A0A914AM12_PATMI|nr:uncharacterized protein LOC119735151 [Patiria miniata]
MPSDQWTIGTSPENKISVVMADCDISGSDSMSECTTAASSGSLIYAVPDDLIQTILQHLSVTDLCHVASCCRWLRDATNQDSLWRPLCKSRGWEHYGTTTDLAKIASYGPSEQVTDTSGAGDDIVTFQEDRIVTDDNTGCLTSTCRWKGVYMRAYHLDRNWATNSSHFKRFINLDLGETQGPESPSFCIDGDLLAIKKGRQAIQVYNIRKKAIQCVLPPIEPTYNCDWDRGFEFRDGVIVVPCSDGVAYAFDASTGALLQKISGNWSRSSVSMFFDGELIITYVYTFQTNVDKNSEKFRDIFVWCVKDSRHQRILTVDPSEGVCVCYNADYRDKIVAAFYDDDYIRVWDARSGECLHKLKCPGEKSNVKLGDNVIVGFSKAIDEEVCDIIIWSQGTGVCQKVIRKASGYWMYPYAQVVNDFILWHERKKSGDATYSLYIYNLRKESVTEMVHHCEDTTGNGSKLVYFVLNELVKGIKRTGKRVVFNAAPNGLVRLFDVGLYQVIWIDDIRMILYDDREQRLLFHHFW